MEINTKWYQWRHGRKPQGVHGWGFKMNGDIYIFTSDYQEAKEQVLVIAKQRGSPTILVIP